MKKKERNNTNLLVSSKTISKIGDMLFDYVNNTFLANANLKSMLLVGIYQSSENIISIIFNLFGGVIADNFKRKKILILTDFLSGCACIMLSLINSNKWLIYSIILANMFLALLSAFSSPAYKAFTKEIVFEQNISEINSYLELASTIVKIIIPLVSLVIYRIIGVRGSLLLDGISFLFSSLIIFFIKPVTAEITKKNFFNLKTYLLQLKSGFKYLIAEKQIFILIILSSVINFILAAYNLILPYSNEMFSKIHGGVYGTFLTAEAIGGLLGAFFSSKLKMQLSAKKLMIFLGLSGLPLCMISFLYQLNSNLLLLSLSPALFNLFLTIYNIQFFSLIQKVVDTKFLGRIFSIIFTVAVLFMPIGTWVFTLLLKPNYEYNFLLVGICIILISLIFLKILEKYNKNA